MSVVVDSSVFSLYLRRDRTLDDPYLTTFLDLFDKDQIILLGVVYQELLSGIRFDPQFDRLSKIMQGFPLVLATQEDHLLAARYFNNCRAHGIQGASFDYLICAMAVRCNYPILTLDDDFTHYAQHIPIQLYRSV